MKTLEEKRADSRTYYAANRAAILARKKANDLVNREINRVKRKAYYTANKEKIAARKKVKYDADPEAGRAATKRRRAANPERYRAQCRANYQKNRETRLGQLRDWSKAKYATDPHFKLLKVLRVRVYKALKRNSKRGSSVQLLGCTIEFLREHLERQFLPGMTWENYGPVWHVDHIRPCASFDLADEAQQRTCFHYTNLQPLWASENLKKWKRYQA